MTEKKRLYSAPPAEFTRERDALARELRAKGRIDEAKEVAALRKPAVGLWIANQLGRLAPGEVKALIDATGRIRHAQSKTGSSDDLREAMRAQRDALAKLIEAGAKAAEEAGSNFTLALQRRVQNTVQAAASSKPGELRDGVLEEELQPSGFGELAGMEIAPPKKSEESKEDAHALRKAEHEAERLEAHAEKLEAAAKQAEADALQSRNAADEARMSAKAAAAQVLELRRK
jgi:hypothetical protein